MSEGANPGMAPNTSNKVMVRNIITGVVTTVVGASIVYFLGFHPKSGSSEDSMQKTLKGWRSYVYAENVLYNDWQVLDNNYVNTGFEHYKQATLDELSKFKYKLKEILDDKDLDKTFRSMVQDRLA